LAEGPASPLRFGIFADDLTGALDAAAPFVTRGLTAYASVTASLPAEFARRGFSVASVNMDSRRLSPSHAAARAYDTVSNLVEQGYRPAFNKVDSTLRGHVGVEALIAVRSGAARGFVLAPAFPANRRTVVDRELRVDGVPVAQTEVGRDALSPVRSSDVVETVRRNCGMEPSYIGLGEVRQGPACVVRLLERAASSPGVVAIAVDGETDEDLSTVAGAGLMTEPDWLLAGSAGLAGAVAGHLAGATGRARPRKTSGETPVERTAVAAPAPYLIVVGSQRAVAGEAARELASSGPARLVTVSGSRLLARRTARAAVASAARRAADHLRASRTVVLLLDAADAIAAPGAGQSTLPALRDALVAGLGEVVATALAKLRPGALVIVGGDTAGGVLKACEAAGIALQAEPLPGTAAGVLDGGSYDSLPVVTKAGAFGDRGTLGAIVRYLEGGGGGR
jgi:uncharacterized protein YgbK (DUF1537 family)